jgi:sugar phosphate isomerase/epimerase
LGVRIAFENTEGEEALHTLLEAFRDEPNAGFCWDTGHEQCYNRGEDLMAHYSNRLFGTHINDNLGIRAYDGTITCIDDLHLLPFDGIVDWSYVAERLAGWGADNILTFELSPNSMSGRHENDAYQLLGLEGYVAECYKRACRVAALVQRARK